jgi:hypothetical protein
MADGMSLKDCDQLQRLVFLLCSADGGCPVCAGRLLEEAIEMWPTAPWDETWQQLKAQVEETKRDKHPAWGLVDAFEWLEDALKARGQ